RFCGSFKLYSVDGDAIRHDQSWMARVLKERLSYNREEIVFKRPNGERVVAMAHAAPLMGDDGELLGAINVLVDITSRKSAEKALQRARRAGHDREPSHRSAYGAFAASASRRRRGEAVSRLGIARRARVAARSTRDGARIGTQGATGASARSRREAGQCAQAPAASSR